MSTDLKKLSQYYQRLFESSEFYDISIQIGKKSNNEYFKAHSLILRIRSPYFRKVLSRYGDKGPKNVILYIYDDAVDLTELEFKEIIYLLWGAQVLCLKELCDYIENIIVEQTDLIKEHISLINRKGFTKLAALVSTDTDPTIINLPTRQLTIQSNLIEQKHIVLIVKWINDISNSNSPNFYTFNLLQRASKHGSGSKKFHARCDDKDNSIVSKVIDTKYAIKQYKFTGPTFRKNDLKICGESKENKKSRCRKGSYEKQIRNSTEFFCVDDYEVFQVFEKLLN
ncbi:4427_t:CDS:2 [Gigaspora margarita]|uniref:4427_t:CDS:1 n=1 Tax=Gigaspora margarita TaxID=4874 RepID=A0ABM8VVK5_GIGMA|nr:4427_t:CDS:2 [Gigaspora margarita]